MAEVSKVEPPLSQGTGYGLILGLGFAFAVGMIGTTWALKRYHGEVQTSEAFSTANRTVKSGLVASAVVSSCQSTSLLAIAACTHHRPLSQEESGYKDCADLNRDVGCNVTAIIWNRLSVWRVWSVLVRFRSNCPNYSLRHTRHRTETKSPECAHLLGGGQGSLWDHHAHRLPHLRTDDQYSCNGNVVDRRLCCGRVPHRCTYCCRQLLASRWRGTVHHVRWYQGKSWTSNPCYTAYGRQATFLTDYVHTVIILVIIFLFAFSAYATNENLGSPGKVWELLTQAGKDHPVDGERSTLFQCLQ